MPNKKTMFTRRVWSLMRLALLWGRKGGAFKREMMLELKHLPHYIKSLRHSNKHESICYREKEFSFDETPMFNFKMHRLSSLRFHIPCITKPQVDFDYDFDNDVDNKDQKNFFREEDYGYETDEEPVKEDKGVDVKAEEFIEKFYKQMKLQRQISYLQYNEMLDRGTTTTSENLA